MSLPVADHQLNDYTVAIRDFYCGLQERARAVNACGKWPKTNVIWETGIAGTITDLGDGHLQMLDNSPVVPAPLDSCDLPEVKIKDWSMPAGTGSCAVSGTSKWVGFHDECSCYVPDFYDIVFEVGGEWDERMIVRGRITAHTEGITVHPTVTFVDLEVKNAITAGFINSISDLTSKEYNFIKHDGMYWSDVNPDYSKWLPFPNDSELWRDQATTGSDKFLRAPVDKSKIEAPPQSWLPDQWAGQEALAYDTTGKLHRLTVVWNDRLTLYFIPKTDPPPAESWIDPSPAFTLTGVFTIVEPGAKSDPKRWSPQVNAWNTGYKQQAYSHHPGNSSTPTVYTDTLMVLQDVAATNLQWDEGSPCNPTTPSPCAAVNHPKPPNSGRAYDQDLWSYEFEECGAPGASDKNYTPKWFWSLGALQRECINLAAKYLDHTVINPAVLTNFTPATFFKAANLNWGSSTVVESPPGTFTAAVSGQYNGYRVWWTVKNADGSIKASGESYPSAGSIVLADVVTADVGKTVIYSAGFTRGDNNGHGPLEVRYLYPKGPIFIPDVDVDPITGEKTVLEVAQVLSYATSGCFGVGQFVTRSASSTFLDHTEEGITIDGVAPIADDLPFRYVGDNWHDPTVRTGSSTQTSNIVTPDSDEGNAKFWDRFYQGTHAAQPQAALDSIRSGEVDDDFIPDGRSLRIKGAAGLRTSWHGGGYMRTETGTASGGSTTTLIDSAKLTTDATGCMVFTAGRWPNDKPHVGLVLRVTNGPNAGLKRPIIDSSVNLGTHTVTYILLYAFPNAITAGTTYEIDEVYEANQFQKRCLRVVEGATTYDLIITHNDDDTFWFEETFNAEPGMTWSVVEPRTGGVWIRTTTPPDPGTLYVKVDATHWYVPVSGADSRGQPWHTNSNENLAYLGEKKYGFMMKGDYITLQLRQELFRAITTLQAFTLPVTWTSLYGCNEFADINFHESHYGSGDTNCGGSDPEYPNAQDSAADFWACVADRLDVHWHDTGLVEPCEGSCQAYGSTGEMPSAWAIARVDETAGVYSADASLRRSYLYALVEDLPTCLPVSVEVWGIAQKAFATELPNPPNDNVFDTMGDGSFTENTWGVIFSESAGLMPDGKTAIYRVGNHGPGGPTGPMDMPPIPTAPTVNGGYKARGYQLVNAVAVVYPTFTCCVA